MAQLQRSPPPPPKSAGLAPAEASRRSARKSLPQQRGYFSRVSPASSVRAWRLKSTQPRLDRGSCPRFLGPTILGLCRHDARPRSSDMSATRGAPRSPPRLRPPDRFLGSDVATRPPFRHEFHAAYRYAVAPQQIADLLTPGPVCLGHFCVKTSCPGYLGKAALPYLPAVRCAFETSDRYAGWTEITASQSIPRTAPAASEATLQLISRLSCAPPRPGRTRPRGPLRVSPSRQGRPRRLVSSTPLGRPRPIQLACGLLRMNDHRAARRDQNSVPPQAPRSATAGR